MLFWFNRAFIVLALSLAVFLVLMIGLWNEDIKKLAVAREFHPPVIFHDDQTVTDHRQTAQGAVQSLLDLEKGKNLTLPAISGRQEDPDGVFTSDRGDKGANGESEKHRIVIVGSGPTALGAAHRLLDLRQEDNNTVVTEKTYPHPSLVNSRTNTGRIIPLDYEIVIAHYNENLNWIKPFADHTLIYHKGSDHGPPFQCYAWERLQNVGRESHTYLYHIITNYDQLADVTIFLPGEIADHRGHCHQDPREFVSSARRGIPCKRGGSLRVENSHIIGQRFLQKPKNKAFRRANLTFADFYKDVYRHTPPRAVTLCWKACFAATKEMIRRHPLDFYKRAIAHVSIHWHQEESHYFERLWFHMFHG